MKNPFIFWGTLLLLLLPVPVLDTKAGFGYGWAYIGGVWAQVLWYAVIERYGPHK